MASRAYSRAGILSRLFNQPLAVTSQTAAIVLGAIGQRFDVSQLFVAAENRSLGLTELEGLAADRRAELRAGGAVDRIAKAMPATKLMHVSGGVAHVPVRGETVSENGIGPESGFTGYDGIAAQVQSADADPSVRGILLDIDSPGGEVSGLFECAAILMGRRGTKPMRAVIRGIGASAAYALACCADEVTLHDLGYAGSIGVITMHADFSEQLAQDGVKVTLFTTGAHKADGNSFEPLPPDVAAQIQTMVEIAGSRFIAHVAAARGLSEDDVRAQQAQIYRGADAVKAGLADKVMGWQDSMDEFEASVNGTARRPASTAPRGTVSPGARSAKGNSMSIENNAPAAGTQPEFTQTDLDAAVAAGRTEAAASASTEAVTAERARIAELAELDAASSVSPVLAAAIADGTSAGDFAIGLAKAARAQGATMLAAAQADAVGAGDLPEGGAAAQAAQAEGGVVNRGAAFAAKQNAAKAA